MSTFSLNRPIRLVGVLAFLCSCSVHSGNVDESLQPKFFTQTSSNRVAAEWEPAVGTMIIWPLCVPYKLVIELAKDNHLYTLVENENSRVDALNWYTKWGIDPKQNTFIILPQGIDSWWVRDWGPAAVFTPDGTMKLADGKYIYSTPVSRLPCGDSLEFIYKSGNNEIAKTETDDSATLHLGKGLNTELLDLPFISTGGNVLTDGLGTAFSTCILVNENRYFGVSREKFFTLNKELLGIERYNIISNFEKQGIQHIDCYMKLLDEERILVIEPPKDHELFPIYENIIQNEIKNLRTPYGRPYQVLRIKSDRYDGKKLAAYTNSLIVNKTVYVPLFNIREDTVALHTWKQVMPGYTIKGFSFQLDDEPFLSQKFKDHYHGYGWKFGDALHCRVRAVWDPKMLFMTARRIDEKVDSKNDNRVYATIIDYSKQGIERDKAELRWRISGNSDWNSIAMHHVENSDHYFAGIPFNKSGTTIEYYLSAVSKSGRIETLPKTAPGATFQFSIK